MARRSRKVSAAKLADPLKVRAQSARGSWLKRCKEKGWPAEVIPSRADIESWLRGRFASGTAVCTYSGAVLKPGDDWELDHAIPLDRGGSPALDNVVICTKQMNQAKGNLPFPMFVEMLFMMDAWPNLDRKNLLTRLRASASIYR